ncbi:MAG: biotin-dependent carboxyltransferase [Planctomycetaceae bacterium]|nr:biotin-dependent carboxyltransferase [Planctomycetaceae bacterium]
MKMMNADERAPCIRLITSGFCTTVQDGGRSAFRHLGVPESGAVDLLALRTGNRLVGNADDTAGLEITLAGPQIEFRGNCVFALTGAPLAAEVIDQDGVRRAVPMNRPIALRSGCQLITGAVIRGCRSYLTVAGGVEVPAVLGSRSTLLKSALGDTASRPLAVGDVLPISSLQSTSESKPSSFHAVRESLLKSLDVNSCGFPNWHVQVADYSFGNETLRILPGPHFLRLTSDAAQVLQSELFEVRSDSDRMGCRLKGPVLQQNSSDGIPSEAVLPGTLQLPADGQILMLMADCAPTGGYPQIAHVIRADWSKMAQLRPGDRLRFRITTREEARTAAARIEQDLNRAVVMAGLNVGPA